MALSKLLVASLLASLLLLQFAAADANSADNHQSAGHGSELLQQIDCNGACAGRCRLSSRPNLCKRACGSCCRRCSCVPPGTAGNQDVCPCYATLTTHGGKRKCP